MFLWIPVCGAVPKRSACSIFLVFDISLQWSRFDILWNSRKSTIIFNFVSDRSTWLTSIPLERECIHFVQCWFVIQNMEKLLFTGVMWWRSMYYIHSFGLVRWRRLTIWIFIVHSCDISRCCYYTNVSNNVYTYI